MTWTFVDTLLTDRDKIRANIGDTDSGDEQFSDEHLAAVLAIVADVNMASAALCDQLAAKYARKVDVGSLSARKAAGQLIDHYHKTADRLRRLGTGDVVGGAGLRKGGIVVTGVLESEYTTAASDTTYAKGPFRLGQDSIAGGYTPSADDGDDDW